MGLRIKRSVFIAVLLLSVGQQGVSQSSLPQSDKTVLEDDLREVVVRYQIAKWDLNAKVYFVQINGKDPTTAFLQRLQDVDRPVKKKSESRREKNVLGRVVEKKTKLTGVVFDTESIHWISEGKADVEGGHLCGGLCSASGTYHLEIKGSHWVVTGYDVSVIS
jgi:hypothetical protein